MENQSKDYNFEYGLYSEPSPPDYNKRIESCLKLFEGEDILSSDKEISSSDSLSFQCKCCKFLLFLLFFLKIFKGSQESGTFL